MLNSACKKMGEGKKRAVAEKKRKNDRRGEKNRVALWRKRGGERGMGHKAISKGGKSINAEKFEKSHMGKKKRAQLSRRKTQSRPDEGKRGPPKKKKNRSCPPIGKGAASQEGGTAKMKGCRRGGKGHQ